MQYASITIPDTWIYISLFFTSVTILLGMLLLANRLAKAKLVSSSLLCEYYFVILCFTVFCRETISEAEVQFIPFEYYWNYYHGKYVTIIPVLIEIGLNILMFVPIGVFIRFLFPSRMSCLKYTLLIGFSLSFVIEILQLILCRGCCETNDLIHNTLGTLMGYVLTQIIIKKGYYENLCN